MKISLHSNGSAVRCVLLISLCFFLTSAGYLAWLYRLIELAPAPLPEILTLGLGYFLQAAGVGLFALTSRRRPDATRKVFAAALALYAVCLAPSVLSVSLTAAVVFGALSNVLCGVVAGCYLHELTLKTDASHRALSFGAGYGLATLATWLLSLIGGGAVYHTNIVLPICAVSVVAVMILLRKSGDGADGADAPTGAKAAAPQTGGLPVAACVAMLLFSLVNHIGFSFPSSDIGRGVNLELSRLFYAVGLVIAGLVSDKSRKHGAVLTLAALVIPFIMLTLRGETVSSVIFWCLSYFASGFFSVYRIILFTDIAADGGRWYLSGFGLLFGRLGESLGTVIYYSVGGRMVVLVVTAALLYAATVFLFFWLYQKLYVPEADRERSERERFRMFAATHDLSAREREVLRLLLDEETTTAIAEKLFVSESTVKFHIHNLLQKTGCRNRKELAAKYYFE